jgi:hypothetical protein
VCRSLSKQLANCAKKLVFETEDQAEAHPGARAAGIHVYPCDVCGKFHLGHGGRYRKRKGRKGQRGR